MSFNFIDYEEDGLDTKDKWTSGTLQKYFNKLLVKHHRAGGHLFTIQEISLLSRLIKIYGSKGVAEMMESWLETCTWQQAPNFLIFYRRAEEINQKLQGFKWE